MTRRIALERAGPEAIGEHGRALRRSCRRLPGRAAGPAPDEGPSPRSRSPPTTPARTVRGSPRPIIVNSMVEKSPKALSVFTPAWRSRISGTEKCVFGTPTPGGALTDVDEPVRVPVHERPQQHAADDAEDGGVGADAERQGQDDGDGKAGHPCKGPDGKLEVGYQAHDASAVRCSRPPFLSLICRTSRAVLDIGRPLQATFFQSGSCLGRWRS